MFHKFIKHIFNLRDTSFLSMPEQVECILLILPSVWFGLYFECPNLQDLRNKLLFSNPDINNTLFGDVSQLEQTSKYYNMAHRRRAKAQTQVGWQWMNEFIYLFVSKAYSSYSSQCRKHKISMSNGYSFIHSFIANQLGFGP